MSMRLLLAGSSAQGSGAGVDGFISRLYDMSAGEIQKFMSIDRNRTLFFAALSGPYPVADLITHPEFATKICGSSPAMTAIAANATAMAAVALSSTAMTAITASTTAIVAVLESSTAMTAIAASTTAMERVAASSEMMNAVLKSPMARSAISAQGAPNNALQQQEIRLRQALGDTRKFTQVLAGHMQQSSSEFGNKGMWGNSEPAPLIVIVKTAGTFNGNVSSYGYTTCWWRHLHNKTYNVGVVTGGDHRLSMHKNQSICIGGISYTNDGAAAIVVDAWRAL